MLVTVRTPSHLHHMTARLHIDKLTAGTVVQRTRDEGERIEPMDCYGHIVSFTRLNGKLALEVKWDTSPVSTVELPENLILFCF